MGLRTGRANRLKWSTVDVLETLARSVTKKELVEGFRGLPVAERLDVLCRLSDSVALSGEGGTERGK
jgi:hypothetical protein